MGKGSRDKGARFERTIARELREWLGEDWQVQRVPGYRQRGEVGQAGDLAVSGPFRFPFCVEVKHYAGWSTDQLFTPGAAMLRDFWSQTVEQAEAVDLLPLLLVRRDRGQTIAVMPLGAARRIVWKWAHQARVLVRSDQHIDAGRVDRVCAVRWLELVKVDPSSLYGLIDGRC